MYHSWPNVQVRRRIREDANASYSDLLFETKPLQNLNFINKSKYTSFRANQYT